MGEATERRKRTLLAVQRCRRARALRLLEPPVLVRRGCVLCVGSLLVAGGEEENLAAIPSAERSRGELASVQCNGGTWTYWIKMESAVSHLSVRFYMFSITQQNQTMPTRRVERDA